MNVKSIHLLRINPVSGTEIKKQNNSRYSDIDPRGLTEPVQHERVVADTSENP